MFKQAYNLIQSLKTPQKLIKTEFLADHFFPLDPLRNSIRTVYRQFGVPWKEVNFFGVHDFSQQKEDTFNDMFGLISNFDFHMYPGTCDPGKYWTDAGGYNRDGKGVAHICDGYHENVFQCGLHRGTPALVQTGAPIRYWRDKNNDTLQSVDEIVQTGYISTNVHSTVDPNHVGAASAGCLVFKFQADLTDFLVHIQQTEAFRNNAKVKISYFQFPAKLVDK